MARIKKASAKRRASRKTIQPTPAKRQTLQNALYNNVPQALIGVAVVLGLIVIGYNVSRRNASDQKQPAPTPTAVATISASITETMTATPVATITSIISATTKPTINPTSTPAQERQMNGKKPVVQKLPATSSDKIFYTVKKGDNSAKIGLKNCNDKRAWLYIVEDNNLYPPYILQPGDIITISCR